MLQELLLAIRHAEERRERIEAAITELLPQWSLAAVVEALQALRGVNMITAVTVMAEVGDLHRFATPRELMGYIGLVPGERYRSGGGRLAVLNPGSDFTAARTNVGKIRSKLICGDHHRG